MNFINWIPNTAKQLSMSCIFISIMLSLSRPVLCQSDFPGFMRGTWKMENQETYEHWDLLDGKTLKGFSYEMKDGQIIISEYLDIAKKGNKWIYEATVLEHNQGKAIEFKLTKTRDAFVFENPNHDFPKMISYKKLTDDILLVEVSDGKDKSFSFKMTKISSKTGEDIAAGTNPNYDKALAGRLGADDYGMKSYIFVILKTGANASTDKELIANSFRGHFENIGRLVEEGKLIVAGPMGKNDRQYRGIFILHNVNTIEDARELMQTDPAIKNGFLVAEIYNWYGSAALPEYLPFSDKIWKEKP